MATHAAQHAEKKSPLLRTTGIVGAAAFFSRILGFIRDMCMAWLLGNSLAADALVIALRLPHVMRRLFGEGSLSMTLTADFIAQQQQHQELLYALHIRLICVLACIVLVGEIFATPIVRLLAPGMGENTLLLQEATYYFRICLPYIFMAGMAALCMARMHSTQRFLLPALTPALFNATVLLFAGWAAWLHLQTPSDNTHVSATLLAWGVLCGGVVQWLIQWWNLRYEQKHAWRFPQKKARQAAQRSLVRLFISILGTGAPQCAMLGAMITASWLPQGGIAALYYAERLLELPLGLTAFALGIAALPQLAHLASTQQYEAFTETLSQAIRLCLCLTLPAMAGLLAIASSLVHILFARGAFGAEAIESTSLALCAYALALPAYGLTRPLLAACNAAQYTKYCAFSGICAIALATTSSVLFTLMLAPSVALLGPPLGVSIGLCLQSTLLYTKIRAHLKQYHVALSIPWHMLTRHTCASILTGITAFFTLRCIHTPWLGLVCAICAGVLVWALTLYMLKDKDYMSLWAPRAPSTQSNKTPLA